MDNSTSDDDTTVMYLCNACHAFYDGFAQCCFEMDHTMYEVCSTTHERRLINQTIPK